MTRAAGSTRTLNPAPLCPSSPDILCPSPPDILCPSPPDILCPSPPDTLCPRPSDTLCPSPSDTSPSALCPPRAGVHVNFCLFMPIYDYLGGTLDHRLPPTHRRKGHSPNTHSTYKRYKHAHARAYDRREHEDETQRTLHVKVQQR